MLNEVLEGEEYLGYRETGLPRNNPSLVRILRILARRYWYELPAPSPEGEKVRAVAQKLADFYHAALVQRETAPEKLKALQNRLERYQKPYFEYTGRFYTFYSLIADAVNDGALNGACGWVLLRKSELVYLLKLAGEVNQRRQATLEKSVYNKLKISDAVVLRIAGLVVYFRRYAALYAVNDGSLPVNVEQLNYWLGSKYLEKGQGGQGKWADAYPFIRLESREHDLERDDGAGSSFLWIDEAKLSAGVRAMLEAAGLSGDADFDEGWLFPDNALSEALKAKLKELKEDPAVKMLLRKAR